MSVDWPGFGDAPRPRADWAPADMAAFLAARVDSSGADILVAAGHAAGYALGYAAANPGRLARLVLLAPTWRGPFPTMTGGQRSWFGRVRRAVDMPQITVRNDGRLRGSIVSGRIDGAKQAFDLA